jgi:hypothetical protein
LSEFQAVHPQVALKIHSTSPEQVIQWVLQGSASIGIRVVPHPLFGVPESQITIAQLAMYDCVDLPSRRRAVAHQLVEKLRVGVKANTTEPQLLLI